MKACTARQYSDQMICGACGLQWDTNDIDPPTCNPVIPPVRKSDPRDEIAKLRKMFKRT